MNKIRERILDNVIGHRRTWNEQYKDLITFYVCSEYFTTIEDENTGIEPDFEEAVIVVEKKWLFQKMKKEGIQDPLKYLKEEYTSDDSSVWYEDALLENKIVAVSFN